jgi:hypothetical protein
MEQQVQVHMGVRHAVVDPEEELVELVAGVVVLLVRD